MLEKILKKTAALVLFASSLSYGTYNQYCSESRNEKGRAEKRPSDSLTLLESPQTKIKASSSEKITTEPDSKLQQMQIKPTYDSSDDEGVYDPFDGFKPG